MNASPQHLIRLSRYYSASRDRVWRAWTEPEEIAAWWGPFGPQHTTCRVETAIGGVFEVLMRAPDGSHHPSRGFIREFVPPKRLVLEGDPAAPDACGAGLPPGATVTITLEEENGGTRLTLHALFPSAGARRDADRSGFSDSWEISLDKLTPYFASDPVGKDVLR